MSPAGILAIISTINGLLTQAAPLIAVVNSLRRQHPDLDLPPIPTLGELVDVFEQKRASIEQRNTDWFAERGLDPTTGKKLTDK